MVEAGPGDVHFARLDARETRSPSTISPRSRGGSSPAREKARGSRAAIPRLAVKKSW